MEQNNKQLREFTIMNEGNDYQDTIFAYTEAEAKKELNSWALNQELNNFESDKNNTATTIYDLDPEDDTVKHYLGEGGYEEEANRQGKALFEFKNKLLDDYEDKGLEANEEEMYEKLDVYEEVLKAEMLLLVLSDYNLEALTERAIKDNGYYIEEEEDDASDNRPTNNVEVVENQIVELNKELNGMLDEATKEFKAMLGGNE